MANGHGGRRPGAGRPRGSKARKTIEIADRAAAEGVTPLELILSLMHRYYAEGKFCLALDAAVKAAPYIHPRLQLMQLSGGPDPVRLQVVEEIIGEPGDVSANGEAPPRAAGVPS